MQPIAEGGFESHLELLQSTSLLKGLTATQIGELETVSSIRQYEPGAFILREGESDDVIYVLLEGTAHLTKTTSFSDTKVWMTQFHSGDVIGELKMVDPQPNSASVVALTAVTAMAIDLMAFAESPQLTECRELVLSNVGRVLAGRLRATTSQGADALHRELEESRARAHAGAFIVLMFTMLATFQLALTAFPLLPERFQPPSSVLSFVMIVYAAIPIAVALKDSPFSLESYGLSVKHWRGDLYWSFLWTLPVLALLLVLKLVLMRMTPAIVGKSVFDFDAVFANESSGFSLGGYLFFLILYIVHSPLQEFIARTGFQGSLQHFAPVPPGKVNWKAILVSNLIFGAAHNYFGFWFCVAVFVPGIYWGMALRQATVTHRCFFLPHPGWSLGNLCARTGAIDPHTLGSTSG